MFDPRQLENEASTSFDKEVLASKFASPDQLTDQAVIDCTTALVDTITLAPSYAGADDVSDLVAATLSGVLALPLETALLSNVSNSLSTLTSSVQDSMAVGEAQKDFNTKNARIGASVKDANQLADEDFTPPQSDAEKFNNKPVTKMKIDPQGSALSALGVSVVQVSALS